MASKVVNAVMPDPSQFMEFLSAEEDGAFVMVNLLRFKREGQGDMKGNATDTAAAEEAYMRYANGVKTLLEGVGGRVVYLGRVTGMMIGEVEKQWDVILLAQYPSIAAFKRMVSSEEYQDLSVYRHEGLEGQLNIKTKPMPVPHARL